ncbi:MAG: class I SAM-dependent methyltransferase [Syntrophales bacterium]|jgi:predicted O-methyltransferase YrrM|nr:class I SAM-dependent methyltransferase [Syntrophales bacterium]MCK9528699.1 class I SAM-dependent methyltransferase [Syntrophales bacterium]MDX9922652.1 class I SAM-dependent methyltransferase [Syntrophales bacterium]
MKADLSSMDIHSILSRPIKGFLDPDEAVRLYELARDASPLGPCLEIGSYCGKSAACLALGCREGRSVLFSIDHHRGSEEQQPGEEYFDPDLLDAETGRIDSFRLFRKTMDELGLQDTVVPIVSTSETVARAWRTPLALVFIDGGHSFDTVFSDYACWAHLVLPGGYLVFHDIFTDPAEGGQAPRQVYRLALASGLFRELPRLKTLGILQRASPVDGSAPATL